MVYYLLVCSQALIIYKGEHKVEETSSHKMPTQMLKFNSKPKQSDPSYESISDNKESSELQVPLTTYLLTTYLLTYLIAETFSGKCFHKRACCRHIIIITLLF